MDSLWTNLSIGMRRFLVLTGTLAVIVAIGLQFHVSSQGDISSTYPKGFRGGTCTIESGSVVIGYSGYFIPDDYEIPENANSAMSLPVLCGKMPSPGTLDITIDLLYPESAREWSLAMKLAQLEDGTPSKILLAVPPKTYESGTITQVLTIGETGKYTLYLSGKDEDQADLTLEIPITVGTRWYDDITQFWPMFLMLAAAIIYKIFRRF